MNQERPVNALAGYAALIISPMFFSTNVVFGRAATDIAPFTLAFLRWSLAAAILVLVSRRAWPAMARTVREQWRLLALLGFLGMFVCGGIVYLALHETTATNGTLIYTTPPVMILLLERFWRGRELRWREMGGVAIAIFGVGIIVVRGQLENLLSLRFNTGDLMFVAAAASWAIYSVILKSGSLSRLGTLPLFAIVASAGAITLAPVAAWEYFSGAAMPSTSRDWMIIAGIVSFASLVAFSTFQFGVKTLGPSIASVFMYLLPPFGVGFAVLFLGEEFKPFHAAGIAVILGGVILATFPLQLLMRRAGNRT